jgi:hypothetical protein
MLIRKREKTIRSKKRQRKRRRRRTRSRKKLKSQNRLRRRSKSQLISHNHLKLLLSHKSNRSQQYSSISLRRKIRRKIRRKLRRKLRRRSRLPSQRISHQRLRLNQKPNQPRRLRSPKRKLNQHQPRLYNNKRRLTSQLLRLKRRSQRKLSLVRANLPKIWKG